jgi:hypothetical protein
MNVIHSSLPLVLRVTGDRWIKSDRWLNLISLTHKSSFTITDHQLQRHALRVPTIMNEILPNLHCFADDETLTICTLTLALIDETIAT